LKKFADTLHPALFSRTEKWRQRPFLFAIRKISADDADKEKGFRQKGSEQWSFDLTDEKKRSTGHMKSRTFGFDRIMAVMAVIVGCVCLLEAKRLFPRSSSILAGDHALPGLTGAAMILLGLVLLFKTKRPSIKVGFPEKPVMTRLMVILGILMLYSISIKHLGYIASTGLAGIPLFRLFGGRTWGRCLALSILCTAGLYAVFVYGLGMSFPRGLF
jgi:putative tricarboxylic transport membrane protein